MLESLAVSRSETTLASGLYSATGAARVSTHQFGDFVPGQVPSEATFARVGVLSFGSVHGFASHSLHSTLTTSGMHGIEIFGDRFFVLTHHFHLTESWDGIHACPDRRVGGVDRLPYNRFVFMDLRGFPIGLHELKGFFLKYVNFGELLWYSWSR